MHKPLIHFSMLFSCYNCSFSKSPNASHTAIATAMLACSMEISHHLIRSNQLVCIEECQFQFLIININTWSPTGRAKLSLSPVVFLVSFGLLSQIPPCKARLLLPSFASWSHSRNHLVVAKPVYTIVLLNWPVPWTWHPLGINCFLPTVDTTLALRCSSRPMVSPFLHNLTVV